MKISKQTMEKKVRCAMKIPRLSSRKTLKAIVDDVDDLRAALPPGTHLVIVEDGTAFTVDRTVPTKECEEALEAHRPAEDAVLAFLM